MLTAAALGGCVNKDADTTEKFDYGAMLSNYADNVILPHYQSFAAQMELLAAEEGALESYCAAIDTPNQAAALSAARADWLAAMALWQQAEVFQVGPAAENEGTLRNRIYSYESASPLSTCAVDQAVVQATGEDFDITTRANSSRGLDALEYLLFNETLTHTCPTQISETQGWNDLPAAERQRQRCAYARRVAADLVDSANGLLGRWVPTGGNYRAALVNPANSETSLKALSDALFYIETLTKDQKLGQPLGLHRDCSEPVACPSTVESIYSQSSLTNIRNNLLAFKQGFSGGSGLGFDDIIVQAGFGEIAQDFIANADAAIELIDSMDSSLHGQATALAASGDDSACVNSAANPETVQEVPACSLHGYLKRITDSLRTDFVTIVNLDLPDSAQSDGD